MSISSLLTPFTLRDLPLKNRIVMAPMTRARAGKSRIPNELMAEYYSQRASAGLIISEGTTISDEANGWNENAAIYTPEMTACWKMVTDRVHAAGGKIFCQLWHCGRASHSSFHADGSLPAAPSAVKLNGEYIHTPIGKQPYETPRALTIAEIARTVNDYQLAAANAKTAGFDGVEIHGANGYLIDSFLQSKTNQRTDDYGGTIEKRFRFLREVVQAVTAVWPANRVGVRLSPNGVFNDMGSPDYREQFLYVSGQLNTFGLAYLHVMDGLGFGFHNLGTPVTLAEFRTLFQGPLMGNCGYTVEEAEARVAAGDADLIAFGRPFISNPDLVERIAQGWPLSPPAEVSDWYKPGAAGYTDFPRYAQT
ncbi:MAG: alkene reductase [Pirellulales bacterium]|nr:alkene reductase [Pirellulales bacterium]